MKKLNRILVNLIIALLIFSYGLIVGCLCASLITNQNTAQFLTAILIGLFLGLLGAKQEELYKSFGV